MLFEADYAKNYASIMYQCLTFTRGERIRCYTGMPHRRVPGARYRLTYVTRRLAGVLKNKNDPGWDRSAPDVHRLEQEKIGFCNRLAVFACLKVELSLGRTPFEAILVIFGFLCESSWKNMKMTPFLCACAV